VNSTIKDTASLRTGKVIGSELETVRTIPSFDLRGCSNMYILSFAFAKEGMHCSR
jgi:hypothetical protein